VKRNLDKKIFLCTILIISFGLIALYSASFENLRVPQKIFYDQLWCAFIGIFLMLGIGRINYKRFYDIAIILYVINILLLIYVFLQGRFIQGAQRWIELGFIHFQPSELSKLAIILLLARYFHNRRPTLSFNFLSNTQVFFRDIIIPLFFVLLPMILIFKQPDLGTSFLLFGIFIVMVFASGSSLRHLAGFFIVFLSILPLGWQYLKPYQKDRLLVFLNPNIDPLGAGYTIIQSKIAVGSGQVFGKGWLAGTQNQLNFLPERHSDFIFSVIGEEWGLLGALLLISCYFLLIHYSLQISEQVRDKFGILLIIGIVSIFTLQVIINIGMVIGLFPIVGLTLPLVSYGRSSFLIFIIMIGLLLNLSRQRTMF